MLMTTGRRRSRFMCTRRSRLGLRGEHRYSRSRRRSGASVVRAFAYAELVTLFSEGRLEVGRRRARSGLDTARAIATLGIDRGSNVSSGSACS